VHTPIHNARAKLKDAITNATELRSKFEVDLAISWNTRGRNFMMGKHTWNATKMFLSRKKSSHEKIEGPPNARGINWDVKYGNTSNRILYIKVSSPQLRFQDWTPEHGQGLTQKNK
jgi:hypothetical protein